MFFSRRYTLSCRRCKTEFITRYAKTRLAFYDAHRGKCPCCGNYLSYVPAPPSDITMPPELKTYPRYKRVEDLDNPSTLEYDRWGQLLNEGTYTSAAKEHEEPIIFADGVCPVCGRYCGNGGIGPLHCVCGWVETAPSEELKRAVDELFTDKSEESEDQS